MNCTRPLPVFLLVDYMTIIVFRISHFVCQKYADSTTSYRHIAVGFKLVIVFPFFAAWTVVGTAWFDESKECLPEDNQKWAFVIWLILCYLWIFGYICLLAVKRICFSAPSQPAQVRVPSLFHDNDVIDLVNCLGCFFFPAQLIRTGRGYGVDRATDQLNYNLSCSPFDHR